MQEENITTNTYRADNERFADIMNVGMFQSKKVLSADKLKEVDSVVFHIIYNFMLHIIYHRFRNCHSGFSTLFNPNYAY